MKKTSSHQQKNASFFSPELPLTLRDLASRVQCNLPLHVQEDHLISGIASLELAQSCDLAYMDNPRYINALKETQAGACLVSIKFAHYVPKKTVPYIVKNPYRSFTDIASYFFPDALSFQPILGKPGETTGVHVHPTAYVDPTAILDVGAVIGAGASIGPHSIIGAHTVIGPRVTIGTATSIGSGVTIVCAHIGDRVMIHTGVRIGQDGFGFALGSGMPVKVPQIGNVLIEDDVEIGANTTIDRGSLRNTFIGQGTKIDNLVQIGHNVVIGRGCIIVAQVGISGSTTLEDGVIIGGQAGLSGHLHLGQGAQLAGASHASKDIPAGARWGGTPARPFRQWIREDAVLRRLNEASSLVKRPKDLCYSEE